ncbi:MAG: hypothetical protein OXE99_07865 [Cellvibrionales bacterium]|nr:hypothetical protein [Cellvibrionales bacterium]
MHKPILCNILFICLLVPSTIYSHNETNLDHQNAQGLISNIHVTGLTILENSSVSISVKVEINGSFIVGENPSALGTQCELYTYSKSIYKLLQDALITNNHLSIQYETAGSDVACQVSYIELNNQ